MNDALTLRSSAEEFSTSVPDLLIAAQRLAQSVDFGGHGRKRAGMGDDFWQYRPITDGDQRNLIDWRRSARGDVEFLREREWQISAAAQFWVDNSSSMKFASGTNRTKLERARVLALATMIAMTRAGERVSVMDGSGRIGRSQAHIGEMAHSLLSNGSEPIGMANATVAIFSDFLTNFEATEQIARRIANNGDRGVLIQILDPAEVEFPFKGRIRFIEDGASWFETRKADDLQSAYLRRLAELHERLRTLSKEIGWDFLSHQTDHSPQMSLLQLSQVIGGIRS